LKIKPAPPVAPFILPHKTPFAEGFPSIGFKKTLSRSCDICVFDTHPREKCKSQINNVLPLRNSSIPSIGSLVVNSRTYVPQNDRPSHFAMYLTHNRDRILFGADVSIKVGTMTGTRTRTRLVLWTASKPRGIREFAFCACNAVCGVTIMQSIPFRRGPQNSRTRHLAIRPTLAATSTSAITLPLGRLSRFCASVALLVLEER